MLRLAACAVLPLALACGATGDAPAVRTSTDTLLVQEAASLVRPVRALLDTLRRREGVVGADEQGGSLELVRRVTELGRTPDVLVLADEEVFPQLLVPRAAAWYVRFARNRMVIAFTARSRHAGEMSAANWPEILMRRDVLVGRPDPVIAPAGYRALLLYELAERHYGRPGLAARLAARSPPARVRGTAAELAVLLETGELDYIIEYESLARTHRFRYVSLPPEIDLGDPARASLYARARTRVVRGGDTVTVGGAPILYAATVPRAAPHPGSGVRFLALLLGPVGRRVLGEAGVDVLERPEFRGDSVPPPLRRAAAP